MEKLCPWFRSRCEKEDCEYWDKGYSRCDIHTFIKVIIDNGGL